MLKPLTLPPEAKGKGWCAPTALALITGMPLRVAVSRFGFFRGSYDDVTNGNFVSEITLALREQGYRMLSLDLPRRYPKLVAGPHLDTFMEQRTPMEKMTMTLVSFHKHVAVVHYDYLFDNWYPKGCDYRKVAKPKRNVTGAWTIEPYNFKEAA